MTSGIASYSENVLSRVHYLTSLSCRKPRALWGPRRPTLGTRPAPSEAAPWRPPGKPAAPGPEVSGRHVCDTGSRARTLRAFNLSRPRGAGDPGGASAPRSGAGRKVRGEGRREARAREPATAARLGGQGATRDPGGTPARSAASALTMARAAGLPAAGPARRARGGAARPVRVWRRHSLGAARRRAGARREAAVVPAARGAPWRLRGGSGRADSRFRRDGRPRCSRLSSAGC